MQASKKKKKKQKKPTEQILIKCIIQIKKTKSQQKKRQALFLRARGRYRIARWEGFERLHQKTQKARSRFECKME